LPDNLFEKQQKFLAFVMYRRIQHDYSLAFISNMDKTSMTFNLPSNITVDEIEAKTISIYTTRYEKTNFTVVLTYMADETKLSSIVIFKLKKILKGNFPLEVIIHTNPTG